MRDEKMYSSLEVCTKLKISSWTLANWYRWEKKQIANGNVSGPYLPDPIRLENTKGKPRRWTDQMLKDLKAYQKSIVTGRNGIYGVYSNPYYKETQKYKKSIETIEQA